MKQQDQASKVALEVAGKECFVSFKQDLKESFAISAIEEFGSLVDGTIPSDKDIEKSFFSPGAAAYHITLDGEKVGGAIVKIDELTQHNSLDLFFLSPESHGRGVGYRAWKAIEEMYPQTKVWVTHTPYFEKRNIHFYVNKCGFKIVAYYNAHHQYPQQSGGDSPPTNMDFFSFEKIMV